MGASEDEVAAARLYDDYARNLPGRRLNFPESGVALADAGSHASGVQGFIDPGTGVYMEKQVGAYCSLHAINALIGSARLGASPAMLHQVERVLNTLDISQVRPQKQRQ